MRTLCLQVVPTGVAVHHTSASPLHLWRNTGTFLVTGCNKNSIVIETAGDEIAAALMADAEHLLDHAAEQRATVKYLMMNSWNSPAWLTVTIYYWAFFSAIAVTRLAGKSVWFLDKGAVEDLRRLAPSSVTRPHAGPLNLTVSPYISATERQIILKPSKLQFHDAVWGCLQDLLSEAFAQSNDKANALEYRLMWCFHEVNHRLGKSWPSSVRNLVNYRPGGSYREVIRDTEIDLARFIRNTFPITFEDLVSFFEDHIVKIKNGGIAANDIPLLVRILGIFTFALSTIAGELHAEVIQRTAGDRRWLQLRKIFLHQHCVSGEEIWPLTA